MTHDEIMAMSAEQLRIAIAEAKGYKFIQEFDDGSKEFAGPRENIGWYYIGSRYPISDAPLPDWPTDIRAALEVVEEAGFVIGPEWTGGFDSVRCGWAVYEDWLSACDDVNSLPGNTHALAIDKTIPLAASRAWLMWNNAK